MSRMILSTCRRILSLPFSSSSIFMRCRKRQASTSKKRKARREADIIIRLRMARESTSEKLQLIWQVEPRACRISCRQKLKGTYEDRISSARKRQRRIISALRGWQRSTASLLWQQRDQSYSILVSSLYSRGRRQQTVQITIQKANADHSNVARARMKQICRLPSAACPQRLFVYAYWHPSARVITELRPFIFWKPLYPSTTSVMMMAAVVSTAKKMRRLIALIKVTLFMIQFALLK